MSEEVEYPLVEVHFFRGSTGAYHSTRDVEWELADSEQEFTDQAQFKLVLERHFKGTGAMRGMTATCQKPPSGSPVPVSVKL